MTEPRFLHDVQLPDSADARQLLRDAGPSMVIDAVLIILREMSAESAKLTVVCCRNPKQLHHGAHGEVLVSQMDRPEFHAGAAAATEDAFWEILNATQQNEDTEKP